MEYRSPRIGGAIGKHGVDETLGLIYLNRALAHLAT